MMNAFIIILCLVFHLVSSQEIGDECQIPQSKPTRKIPGKCVILQDCSEAIEGFREGKLPYICGYRKLEAIVCCPTKPKVASRVQLEKPDEPIRISRQKCAEYGKSVFQTRPVITLKGENKFVNISICASNKVDLTLIGSIYAKEREFPHMALVGVGPANDKQWSCTGSLISDQFVLTVAHCTMSRLAGEVKWVRLGDLDFESPNDDSMFFDYSVLKIHRHPKYRPPVLYNDIALLELERRVTFSEYIRPACLYTGSDDTMKQFMIAGWALTEVESRGHLRQYKHLKKVGNKKCNEEYKNLMGRRLKDGIVENLLLCTEEAKNDACEISSGAALQIRNNEVYCMYDIVAVTSFGKGFCASLPVVHTRVAPYINWIEAIVWPQVIHMM